MRHGRIRNSASLTNSKIATDAVFASLGSRFAAPPPRTAGLFRSARVVRTAVVETDAPGRQLATGWECPGHARKVERIPGRLGAGAVPWRRTRFIHRLPCRSRCRKQILPRPGSETGSTSSATGTNLDGTGIPAAGHHPRCSRIVPGV